MIAADVARIVPPHAVTDATKVAGILAAYLAGEDVPAVVVLDYGHALVALSGSHRLAAMRELDDDESIDDLVIVVDVEQISAAGAADDEDAADALASVLAGRGDMHAHCRALLAYLPEAARAALAHQADQ